MFKKIFIIITFLLFNSISNAEVVNKIQIDGNKRISDETIKVYGEIKLNKDYSEAELNKILNNLYSTDFFEDINLKINNNTLNIQVKEYPVVNKLIFVGE
jgi:outer membrane protein insertion porin family